MEEIMERARWSRLLTALVSVVAICAPVAALSQAGASATHAWSTAAPLISARSAGVVFSLAGRIVYAGGECKDAQASVTFPEVEAYDPRTNQWTVLPALAPGRHAAAAAAVGEQAYLFGGNLGCGGNRPSKDRQPPRPAVLRLAVGADGGGVLARVRDPREEPDRGSIIGAVGDQFSGTGRAAQ